MGQPGAHEVAIRRLAGDALGARVVRIAPIDAGLSLRRFYRVWLAGGPETPESAVARIEAPEDPAGRPAGAAPEPPLEPLRSFLARSGIPVPACHARDDAAGLALLEDFGDVSLASFAAGAAPAERRALYNEACRIAARIQRVADPGAALPAFRRRLDGDMLAYKADLFAAHSLPAALGRAPRPEEAQAVRDAFAWIAARIARAPFRLAHRDFQGANLLVRAGQPPGARLGVIDFQGAFLAPPEYDLVCLLRDSYVELPDTELRNHLGAVRPILPDVPEPACLEERFDLLTLARKGKDHARFLLAARSRGDRRYLRHLPATVRALRAAAARTAHLDPRLARLAVWIEGLPESACAR